MIAPAQRWRGRRASDALVIFIGGIAVGFIATIILIAWALPTIKGF